MIEMILGKQLIIYGAIALVCSLLLGRYVFAFISCVVIVVGIVNVILNGHNER